MAIITARKISTSRFDMVYIVATSSLEATSKPVSPALPCGSPSPPSHLGAHLMHAAVRRCAGTSKEPACHSIICFLGPLGHVTKRGDRATAPIQHICGFSFFVVSFCSIRFSKGTRMRRVDLYEATMAGLGAARPVAARAVFPGGPEGGVAARPA